MNFFQSFKLAVSSIIDNKMRSFLTMLGMIIGVAAVIALVSLMQAMTIYISDSFSEQGTDTITVNVQNTSTRKVSYDDMYDFWQENPELFASMSPDIGVQAKIKKGMDTTDYTTVKGVAESYLDLAKLKLAQGRYLEYSDILSRENVCVIGSYIVKELFTTDEVIGEQLKINNQIYTIIGVLEEKSDSTERTADDVIHISYSNALKLTRVKDINSYVFIFTEKRFADAAKSAIEDFLFDVFKDEDFYYVFSMKELLDLVNQQLGMMETLLVGIAGISLLVAGIGIMNIMLVSVSERTREIGIRKALGAKRKNIMSQFVIEAAMTSSVGGGIGIILGGALTTVLGTLIGFNAAPTFAAVSVSFGISAGIGILFGYLPASRASKLNPIDALRSE
jgi:ABC-type antimicrobial peptide transport system, permease component